MQFRYLLILTLFLLLIQCVPEKEIYHNATAFDLEDKSFLDVLNHQENQDLDSLLLFSKSPISANRYKTALAFASYQNKGSLDSLYILLQDPVAEIRAAAAYSIGQISESNSSEKLIEAFKQKDSTSVNTESNMQILEALGKLGQKDMLDFISTTTSYKDTDDNLLLGQARAIYRFALRGITTPAGTSRIIALVLNKNTPNPVRTVAANYLMRAKGIDFSKSKFQLLEQLQKEKVIHVKIALASALAKINDVEIADALVDVYKEADDYRIKTNILKSFSGFRNERFNEEALYALADKNVHISTSAADYLIKNGSAEDVVTYRENLKTNLHPKVKAKLYKAILTQSPAYFTKTRQFISSQIITDINNTTDPYHKGYYIDALSTDINNYPYLQEIEQKENSPIVKSAIASGLGAIYNNPNLTQVFNYPTRKRAYNRAMAQIIEEQMRKGDIGAIASLSNILLDPKNGFKNLTRTDYMYLDTVKNNLKLPRDLEAYNAIVPAANYLLDTTFQAYKPVDHKTTDWNLLKELSDTSYVKVVTSKGDITFRFFTKEAPATVANFISLANANFYDNKVFHRVIPNFVIQGGCTRGDGYGSPDYTIRSELPPLYYDDEGMVGMASAGLHTESAQFFITHSPTMHLDGKYTLFGKVVDGMDVVHSIQEGDLIKDVQIIND